MAQQASIRISSSKEYMSFVKTVSAGEIYAVTGVNTIIRLHGLNNGRLTRSQSGWGDLPLQKLLNVQVAFLSMLSL